MEEIEEGYDDVGPLHHQNRIVIHENISNYGNLGSNEASSLGMDQVEEE